MMKGRILIIVLLALGVASAARAQQPVALKFSRVVDLTLPIESNMPGIPGIKTYADNPSKVVPVGFSAIPTTLSTLTPGRLLHCQTRFVL